MKTNYFPYEVKTVNNLGISNNLLNYMCQSNNNGIPKLILIRYSISSGYLPRVLSNTSNYISYSSVKILNRRIIPIHSHILQVNNNSKFEVKSILIFNWNGSKIYSEFEFSNNSDFDKCDSDFDTCDFYFNKDDFTDDIVRDIE